MTREAITAVIGKLEEDAPLDGPEGEFWMGYRRALTDVQDAVEALPSTSYMGVTDIFGYINSAEDKEERARRKTEVFATLWGEGPGQ